MTTPTNDSMFIDRPEHRLHGTPGLHEGSCLRCHAPNVNAELPCPNCNGPRANEPGVPAGLSDLVGAPPVHGEVT